MVDVASIWALSTQLVVFVAALIAVVWALPRIWRGELGEQYERASADMWLWGEPLRRGLIRSLPLGLLASVALALLVITTSVVPVDGSLGAVNTFGVVAFLALVVAGAAVVLFNRPRWLVPPHHRHERGALFEWLERLRSRRGPSGATESENRPQA